MKNLSRNGSVLSLFLPLTKVDNLIRLLILFLIVTSITGQVFFAFSFSGYRIFLFRIILPILWFLFLTQILFNQGKLNIAFIKTKSYLFFLMIWFCYAVFSLGWALSKIAVIEYTYFLFVGFSIIFFIVFYYRSLNALKTLYFLWILIAIGLLIIGFWEYLTGNHLPYSRYFNQPNVIRPAGTFYNTNELGTYLGLTFPFIFAWLHYKKRIFEQVFGYALLFSSFYLLVVAITSRANILAFFLEIFVLFFFLARFLRTKIRLVIATLLVFAALWTIFPNFVQEMFEQTNIQVKSLTMPPEENISVFLRINLAKSAFFYLLRSFGLGVGAGNIESNITNFQPYDVGVVNNLHNWWLEILANFGIFIFFGYLVFYFGLIFALWKIYWRLNLKYEKIICEALLLSLIGFSVACISSSSILAFKPQWILFALALAFLNYYRNRY